MGNATTEVYFDPFDDDIKDDPYGVYRRLRDEAPLYFNDRHQFYAVSRFADVERGLTDNETFLSAKGNTIDVIRSDVQIPPGMFISEDPPQHTKHRQILSILFTPRAVSSLEPQIRNFCAKTLDALAGERRFDFVRDIGAQVPMRVIGMLVGIPEKDQEMLRDQFDESMQGAFDPDEEPFAAMANAIPIFADYLDWRRKHPSDDLMTQLMRHEFVDETGTTRQLAHDELLTYLILVAAAGNDTTNRLIGWTGKVLGDNPDQRRAVAADPSLIKNTIEEVLRLEPPAYHIARYVARDTEFAGRVVPRGSVLLMLPGAANRDDRAFSDPDACDIHRKISHHFSFGYGPHFCLGAALARLEGCVVLDEVLRRFPDWEVDTDAAALTPGFRTRGWRTLPVTV